MRMFTVIYVWTMRKHLEFPLVLASFYSSNWNWNSQLFLRIFLINMWIDVGSMIQMSGEVYSLCE